MRTGLGNEGCYNLESADVPGSFIRHNGFKLQLNPEISQKQYREDATFCTMVGLMGAGVKKGVTIRAWECPSRSVRHYSGVGYVAAQGGVKKWDALGGYAEDLTWVLREGWA